MNDRRVFLMVILSMMVLMGVGCKKGLLTFEGIVWEDLDGTGVKETNEPPLKNVTVFLINAETDEIIDRTTTDQNGRYALTPIQLENKMRVEVEIPEGMAVTFIHDEEIQNSEEIVNQVNGDGHSRVMDPAAVDRPAGQETTLFVHAGFIRPEAVGQVTPPNLPTPTPEQTPTATDPPTPMAPATPTPTATVPSTPTAEPTEVSQNIDPSILPLEGQRDSVMITIFGGKVRNCQSGEILGSSGFANIHSFTYPLMIGADPAPVIQNSDRFNGEILFNPLLPMDSQICTGVGFYNPNVGSLPVNPAWAFDQVGSGSFFTCTFQDATQRSGYSVFNGSQTDQFSLTEDSSAEIIVSTAVPITQTLSIPDNFENTGLNSPETVSSYIFDIPRWLLADTISIGPTGTDSQNCTESGLSEDLSGQYNLPLYIQLSEANQDQTCLLSAECGTFVQHKSNLVSRTANIFLARTEDKFSVITEPPNNDLIVYEGKYLIPIGKFDHEENLIIFSPCQEGNGCNVFQVGELRILGVE